MSSDGDLWKQTSTEMFIACRYCERHKGIIINIDMDEFSKLCNSTVYHSIPRLFEYEKDRFILMYDMECRSYTQIISKLMVIVHKKIVHLEMVALEKEDKYALIRDLDGLVLSYL